MTDRHTIGTTLAAIMVSLGLSLGSMSAVWAGDSSTNRGGLSIGPRFAVIDPKDDHSRPFGGAQARLHLGNVLAFEASADARRDTYSGSTKVWTVPVQVSTLLYLIPTGPISPFVLGGAGWYYTKVETTDNVRDSQNRFGLHAGAGLQWWLSDGLSIDGTYRYLWVEKLESKDVNLRDKKFDDSGHMFTVGLNFHF